MLCDSQHYTENRKVSVIVLVMRMIYVIRRAITQVIGYAKYGMDKCKPVTCQLINRIVYGLYKQ